MMMFDKLTKTDKKMIENYIIENVGSLKNPLEFILKPWDEAKSGSHLSFLFKDTLIFKEEVEFEESFREISERIEQTIGYYSEHRKFEDAIRKIYYSYSRSDNEDWYIWDNILTLFNTYTLATNKIELYENNPRKYIPLADGTQLKIQNGAKPMRIIEKIATSYNIPGFEEYRLAHSRCLNTKKLKGELCISIHPLDYMTMSDNDSGWSSCMSWIDGGEYKQGTVEMMNSHSVVVAYLTAKQPMYMGDGEHWNNKKWRSLFIVDPNFIMSVKSYPYENNNLTKEVMRKLAELQGWGKVEPTEYTYYDDNAPVYVNGVCTKIRFTTNSMYNDFGTCTHWVSIDPDYENNTLFYENYCYSGDSECMVCGCTDHYGGIGHDEGSLMCGDCDDQDYCEHCNESCYETYATADGVHLCSYCFSDMVVRDDITEEEFYSPNCINIFLNKTNDKTKYDGAMGSITIHRDTDYSEYIKGDIIPIHWPYHVCPSDEDFFITIDQLTSEGRELFDLPDEEA